MSLSSHGPLSSWATGCARHEAHDCTTGFGCSPREKTRPEAGPVTGGSPAPPPQGVPSWSLKLFFLLSTLARCPSLHLVCDSPVSHDPFPSLALSISPMPLSLFYRLFPHLSPSVPLTVSLSLSHPCRSHGNTPEALCADCQERAAVHRACGPHHVPWGCLLHQPPARQNCHVPDG